MTFNRKVESALVADAAGGVVRRRSSLPRKMLAGMLKANETAPTADDATVHVEKTKAENVSSKNNLFCQNKLK